MQSGDRTAIRDAFGERAHVCAHAFADGFAPPGAEKHYPPDLELEPIHLEIRLRVDLEAQSVDGRVTHTVRARHAGAREIVFHAVALEDLTAADPAGGELAMTYDGAQAVVTWRDAFAAGEERKVELAYRAERPSGGLYFSRPNDAYPEDPWYAATDHETERARHWLPTVDLPAVRPRLDMHLTAADRFTILANGALVAETRHGDGTKTAHWRLDYPCPSYLTCFAIGEFVRADDRSFGDVPIAYFTSTQRTADDLRRSFGRTPDMMAWLTGRLDQPFPFPKYYQFALPGFVGAMENISLVSWNDQYVVDEAYGAEIVNLVDLVNIHEMAHSYFGDAIVIRDYAHAWLKESWATYLEQVWLEETVSADEAAYRYVVNSQAYFREADDAYKRPIVTREFASSWDMYDRHLYPGGACRLHTLRHLLGDDVFWAGVRQFVARHMGQVVETEDFRRAMEEASGRSLVQWFEHWFHSPGYPALKATFRYDGQKHRGVFEIEQTQADPKAGIPVFRFDLDLAVVVDGQLHVHTVTVSEAKHSFAMALTASPEQVRVDPFQKVLHKLEFQPGDDKLRRQLREAADVPGRIAAVWELAKTGRDQNVAAIARRFAEEPFWGVRIQMARAVADAGTVTALDALAEMIREEEDPRALAAVIAAAADQRDGAPREALRVRIEAGLPPGALRAAYEALGSQRGAAPYATLEEAARRDSYAGLPQSGALRGLALTRRPEAISVLTEQAAYGAASHRARPAAAMALGEIGRMRPRREQEAIRETLAGLLRDPHPRMRVAAVAALRALGSTAAIDDLEAYGRRQPHQDRVAVDRAIRAIRGAQEARATEAEKDTDALRAELRKLRDEVEKIRAEVELQARQTTKPKRAPKRSSE